MESVYTYTIFFVLVGVLALPYWIRTARARRATEEKVRAQRGNALVPVTLHPHIDVATCIGCASCVNVCPESVLGIVHGHAAVVHGLKCVGHALCAEVCPVGAITMGFGTPKQGEEIPWYDDTFQTNIPGLYIVGELGGVGLIKNAVTQAQKAVDAVSARTKPNGTTDVDVLIVGAGPAGLTAALAAQERGLRYVVLEQNSIGGTIYQYPRQKLVLTSPVRLPLYGPLKFNEVSKEKLLAVWQEIVKSFALNITTQTKLDGIEHAGNLFRVTAGASAWTAQSVILAMGRRGSPRKLGVPGEELPKTLYQLIDAESYQNKRMLIVGGGDSAVEAAVALARQRGNVVTISYRRNAFVRLKEKNEKSIADLTRSKKIQVVFESEVTHIGEREVRVREASGTESRLPNDMVFVFAGGELPGPLLKSIGVRLRVSEEGITSS